MGMFNILQAIVVGFKDIGWIFTSWQYLLNIKQDEEPDDFIAYVIFWHDLSYLHTFNTLYVPVWQCTKSNLEVIEALELDPTIKNIERYNSYCYLEEYNGYV